jgi:hypothetical protein
MAATSSSALLSLGVMEQVKDCGTLRIKRLAVSSLRVSMSAPKAAACEWIRVRPFISAVSPDIENRE